MPGAAWRSAVNTCLCGLLLEKLDRHVTNREPGAENWYASITKVVEAAFLYEFGSKHGAANAMRLWINTAPQRGPFPRTPAPACRPDLKRS